MVAMKDKYLRDTTVSNRECRLAIKQHTGNYFERATSKYLTQNPKTRAGGASPTS